MTKHQKEINEVENNLPKKEFSKPVVLELQIANSLEELANFQAKNLDIFKNYDQTGEANSQIIINFDIKKAIKQLKNN